MILGGFCPTFFVISFYDERVGAFHHTLVQDGQNPVWCKFAWLINFHALINLVLPANHAKIATNALQNYGAAYAV